MTADLMPLLLAAGDAAHAAPLDEPSLSPLLMLATYGALTGLCLGMVLCLWRLVRGPSLADRVLAADLLALHVVGVVIVLTIYLYDMVFFDAALAVGILGFVSTVGFAQYIHATTGNPRHPHGDAPDPANLRPARLVRRGSGHANGSPRMNTFFDLLAAGFLIAGLFFFFVGAVGIVKLPDVYHRLHAASKSSTLGLMGLLLAATCHMGTTEVGVKALAVMLFIFVANPIGSHLLAKAALKAGAPQWEGTMSDATQDAE